MAKYMYRIYSDINECQESTSGCSQECSNIVGSYVCSCYAGYRLTSDRHSCIGTMNSIGMYKHSRNAILSITDIDECGESISGCAQLCHNTVGSYSCSCDIGYTLGSNNHSCEGTLANSIIIYSACAITNCYA